MEENGKIVVGVLAGIAIGATLGILFAPDKGSNTRRKISGKADDYADDVENKFNQFIDNITKEYETLKKEAAHAAQNGKAKAEDFMADVNAAAGL